MTAPADTTIIDTLVERGLVANINEALSLVRRGRVMVDGERVYDPLSAAHRAASVRISGSPGQYASRGGEKLEHALRSFGVAVEGRTCLDIGASTGGFTDCLLGFGASRVYAVDVGYGILDWELRIHPRVVVIERCNARYLTKARVPEQCDIATMDVSHISIVALVQPVFDLLSEGGVVVALAKPQFEIRREWTNDPEFRRGVICDERLLERVIADLKIRLDAAGVDWECDTESPLLGAKGNREFFALLKRRVRER